MEKKEKGILKSILTIIIMIILSSGGILFFLEGLFPKILEIVPTETQVNAYLHTRSTFPPFANIEEFIPNIKQAVIKKERGTKSGTTYRVEIETYNRKSIPVTNDTWGYAFKQELQTQINDSIRNRTPFTRKFRATSYILFGIGVIIIAIFSILSDIRTIKRNVEKKKNREILKNPTNISMKNQHQATDTESEKYKDINGSIIK
jgi:hypothetical protein